MLVLDGFWVAGNSYAAEQLADLLIKQDRVDGAIDVLQKCVDQATENKRVAERLDDILAEQGRINELWSRSDAGDFHAAQRLVQLVESRENEQPDAVKIMRTLGLNADGSIAANLHH